MNLSDLVTDWGGFEKFVADLHNTGDVQVQHNVILKGQSGAPRQIDVLITHTQGLYTHKVIVECKYWNTKIKRMHIDAMITQMYDLNASKAVFFTVKGCQSGAKTMAEQHGIEIFLVRELEEEEWGAPGPIIDFYLQIISRSFRDITFPGITAFSTNAEGSPRTLNFNIVMGQKGQRTATPVIRNDGSVGKTLEDLIDEATLNAAKNYFKNNAFIINGGENCTRYCSLPVIAKIQPPAHILQDDVHVLVPEIHIDLFLRIDQSRILKDRRDNFVYAIIVEDVIRHGKFYASRRNDESNSVITPVPEDTTSTHEDVLRNGSIFHVYTDMWFDHKEVAGLTPVPIDALKANEAQSE